MNLAQAIEHANALAFPGFLVDDQSLTDERRKNEEAIGLLLDAWKSAPAGQEPFSFALIQSLADQNRIICDKYGAARLRNDSNDFSLARKLSDEDLVRSVAAMQHRPEADVAASAGPLLQDLGVAYTEAPVSGTVMGIDLETTDRYPDRGYIINLGMEFMDLSPKAKPHDGHTAYFGIPSLYQQAGVPLSDIHHITWDDLAGKPAFRDARREQEARRKREEARKLWEAEQRRRQEAAAQNPRPDNVPNDYTMSQSAHVEEEVPQLPDETLMLVWSIILTVLCSIPGIVGLVKTIKARKAVSLVQKAKLLSSAKIWLIIGTAFYAMAFLGNLF